MLTVIYVVNVFAPPPPNPRALAIGALAAWVFLPWAYWIDRHRPARAEPRSSGAPE